ncbi:sarcosine oxidase subunit delta [Litorivivens sp.]|uniref:sarcosine oxidase subunit delta n=1 Tax=Litorivivens sp. TaxID=2020868 RepID=UPI0035623B32
MHLISCPWCGERSEDEFTCGGQSHIQRPDPDTVTDEEWSAYMFNRINPAGIHFERWRHTFGCRQWFNIARHTVTHEIFAIYKMGEPAPVIENTPAAKTAGGAQ